MCYRQIHLWCMYLVVKYVFLEFILCNNVPTNICDINAHYGVGNGVGLVNYIYISFTECFKQDQSRFEYVSYGLLSVNNADYIVDAELSISSSALMITLY